MTTGVAAWWSGLAIVIVTGALWLPVSAMLAGNLRLEFTDGPEAWWTVTQLQPALSLLFLIGLGATVGWRHWRRRDRRAA